MQGPRDEEEADEAPGKALGDGAEEGADTVGLGEALEAGEFGGALLVGGDARAVGARARRVDGGGGQGVFIPGSGMVAPPRGGRSPPWFPPKQ